jgi:choline monooxygenase
VQTCAPAEQADARIDYDARQRIGDGAIYAWIYPNLMLNRYGSCLDTNYVVPLAHDTCKVIYEFYFLDSEGEAGREFVRRSMEQSALTQQEDIEICESVQRGLGSFSYLPGRYAPRVEHGEHQFHRLLHAELSRAIASGSGRSPGC